jgi:hypothetical protein
MLRALILVAMLFAASAAEGKAKPKATAKAGKSPPKAGDKPDASAAGKKAGGAKGTGKQSRPKADPKRRKCVAALRTCQQKCRSVKGVTAYVACKKKNTCFQTYNKCKGGRQ